MSKRASKRAKANLKARQAEFDKLKTPQGVKRPGSLNPRKGRG